MVHGVSGQDGASVGIRRMESLWGGDFPKYSAKYPHNSKDTQTISVKTGRKIELRMADRLAAYMTSSK